MSNFECPISKEETDSPPIKLHWLCVCLTETTTFL